MMCCIDNVHLFCECILVREAWYWVRWRLLGLMPNSGRPLNLMYKSVMMESEAISMIGIYVQLVWNYVICKKKHLNLETMRSEYELKYITHQKSNMPDLGHIVGLIDYNILTRLIYYYVTAN